MESRNGALAHRSMELHFVQRLRQLYTRQRRCEISACVLGLLGILLMLTENEMLMGISSASIPVPSDDRDTVLVVLKALTSISSLTLVLLILVQYATRTEIRKMQNTIAPSTNFFLSQYRMIVLEILLCGFHIPPGVRGNIPVRQFHSAVGNGTVTDCPVSSAYEIVRHQSDCFIQYEYPVEALGVFMVVRLYLLGRYLRSSSSLYSQWVAFVGSLNDINAMKPFFHFKALFKVRPLLLLVPLALLNTVLSAAIIRILEHPVQASFANYWKSVWLTAVTMTATGFGDYFPVTVLGRGFTIISAMFGGLLLVTLVQSLFYGALELAPRELKIKYLIELDAWQQQTKDEAAQVIQAAWYAHTHQHAPASQHTLYSKLRAARALRAEKPEMRLNLEEQVAEMEHLILARMQAMEAEEAKILQRIQGKTKRLQQLRAS